MRGFSAKPVVITIVATVLVGAIGLVGWTTAGASPTETRALIIGLMAGGLTAACTTVAVRAVFDQSRTRRLTKAIKRQAGGNVVAHYESPTTVTVTGDAGQVMELLTRIRDAGSPYSITVRAPRVTSDDVDHLAAAVQQAESGQREIKGGD